VAQRNRARVPPAARSDLAAAVVGTAQGLPDLLALGREPAFLAGLDEIGRRLERGDLLPARPRPAAGRACSSAAR
jgi:hypothetical protein